MRYSGQSQEPVVLSWLKSQPCLKTKSSQRLSNLPLESSLIPLTKLLGRTTTLAWLLLVL